MDVSEYHFINRMFYLLSKAQLVWAGSLVENDQSCPGRQVQSQKLRQINPVFNVYSHSHAIY